MTINLEFSQFTDMIQTLDANTMRMQAVRSFNQAYLRGQLGELVSHLIHRDNHLRSLSSQPVSSHRSTSHIVTVPIREIQGSLDRSEDFDRHFNPLNERSRERWVSILTAIRRNIPMPAVELVQVGECYYVQDGHHRISVARSLDQESIEARIVN